MPVKKANEPAIAPDEFCEMFISKQTPNGPVYIDLYYSYDKDEYYYICVYRNGQRKYKGTLTEVKSFYDNI